MSTVVNGHREEGGSSHAPRPPHGRPHILPMLSFSASTPTDEDNPLEAALMIDSPLYEQAEHEENQPDEHTPLVLSSRSVVLVDGERSEEDEDEKTPLLTGGGGGGGSRDGSDGSSGSGSGNRGPLALPLNMSRSQGHSSSSDSRGEATTNHINHGLATTTDQQLINVANHFVEEILTKAQEEASKKDAAAGGRKGSTVTENGRPVCDERMLEVVRSFVSDIMAKAKMEAYDSMVRQIHNNNNLVTGKEEGVAGATAAGQGHGQGTVGLASPGSGAHGNRFWRRGPWYAQMGRVFATFLSRICPCRCPTKP